MLFTFLHKTYNFNFLTFGNKQKLLQKCTTPVLNPSYHYNFLTLLAAPLMLSNCSMCGPRFNFSTFLSVLPESGVMSNPAMSDILSQWRVLIPGLHRMAMVGMNSCNKIHKKVNIFFLFSSCLYSEIKSD